MKRLKIAQQIIIVLIFAVLVPSIVIGIIINNVSQQSIRRELNYSAKLLARVIGEDLDFYLKNSQEELGQISNTLKYIGSENVKKEYLNDISKKYKKFKNFKIITDNQVLGNSVFNSDTSTLTIYAPLNNNKYLSSQLDIEVLKNILAEKFKEEKRLIYLLDSDNALIATNAKNSEDFEQITEKLPQKRTIKASELFGNIKNQPMAYYELENPKWTVVVNTTQKITKSTINLARFRIILAITLSGLFIIFLVGLYTYYLYINIRQLFKGIIAVSKGSYDRKIYLLKNIFTPHEIVFLTKEFNFMAKKIAQSHQELYEKNLELQRLDGFRANLVSATSHEFRTPLTNIVGYSSRLLRSDITIDEETKLKSLKIIKQQAQRLARMVEDLLIVPDIETYRLKLDLKPESLEELLNTAVFYVNSSNTNFDTEINSDLKPVFVDKDRTMQILVNLCDNAIKYKKEDSAVKIKAYQENNLNVVEIINKHDKIKDEDMEKLFGKFIRLDNEITNATRGTGLGLFIVRGIAQAMNIDVSLKSDEEYFTAKLVFNEPKAESAEYDEQWS